MNIHMYMIAEVLIILAYQFAFFLIYGIISVSFSKLICLLAFTSLWLALDCVH